MDPQVIELGGLDREQAEHIASQYRADGSFTEIFPEPGGRYTLRVTISVSPRDEDLREILDQFRSDFRSASEALRELHEARDSQRSKSAFWLNAAGVLTVFLLGVGAYLAYSFRVGAAGLLQQLVLATTIFLAFFLIQAFREWYFARSQANTVRRAVDNLQQAINRALRELKKAQQRA